MQPCKYIGPEISPEQFIAEYFFLYLVKGTIQGYDGSKNYALKPGEYCVVRKNHLARYNKQKEDGEFEKVVIIFAEPFLKDFQNKHKIYLTPQVVKGAFLQINKTALVPNFIQSLSQLTIIIQEKLTPHLLTLNGRNYC